MMMTRASRAIARMISTFCRSAMRSSLHRRPSGRGRSCSAGRARGSDRSRCRGARRRRCPRCRGRRCRRRDSAGTSCSSWWIMAMPCCSARRGVQLRDGLAEDLEPAGIEGVVAADDLADRRLAGAVLADDAMHLAGAEIEVDAIGAPASGRSSSRCRSGGRRCRACRCQADGRRLVPMHSPLSSRRDEHGDPSQTRDSLALNIEVPISTDHFVAAVRSGHATSVNASPPEVRPSPSTRP